MRSTKLLALNRFLLSTSPPFRWTVCGVYTVFVTIMSVRPTAPLLPRSPFDHFDKVAHFAAYGLYAALLLWTAPFRPDTKWRWFSITVAFCGMYGIVMEILQATISGGARTGSVADAAANAAGAVCAAAVAVSKPDLFVDGVGEHLETES